MLDHNVPSSQEHQMNNQTPIHMQQQQQQQRPGLELPPRRIATAIPMQQQQQQSQHQYQQHFFSQPLTPPPQSNNQSFYQQQPAPGKLRPLSELLKTHDQQGLNLSPRGTNVQHTRPMDVGMENIAPQSPRENHFFHSPQPQQQQQQQQPQQQVPSQIREANRLPKFALFNQFLLRERANRRVSAESHAPTPSLTSNQAYEEDPAYQQRHSLTNQMENMALHSRLQRQDSREYRDRSRSSSLSSPIRRRYQSPTRQYANSSPAQRRFQFLEGKSSSAPSSPVMGGGQGKGGNNDSNNNSVTNGSYVGMSPKSKTSRSHRSASSGSKRCMHPGCDKVSVSKGLCRGHGGGRRCHYEGCTKGAQSKSNFCWAHGGGQRCDVKDCMKSRKSKHYCVTHLYLEKEPYVEKPKSKASSSSSNQAKASNPMLATSSPLLPSFNQFIKKNSGFAEAAQQAASSYSLSQPTTAGYN